jgi:hypothetical protein
MPSHRSDPRLLVLHGLRIKGTAEAASVAAAVGLPAVQVARLLDQLAAAGLVARTDGLLTGWSLTRAGRAEHSRALRAELDGLAARPTVEAAYRRFLDLNPGVLDACSRWQVRERRGRPIRNDHDDHRYDERVLRDLDGALAGVRPTSDRLASGGRDRLRHQAGHPELPHRVVRDARGSAGHPGHRPLVRSVTHEREHQRARVVATAPGNVGNGRSQQRLRQKEHEDD